MTRLARAGTNLVTRRTTESSEKSVAEEPMLVATATKVSKLTSLWKKFEPETRDHLRQHKAAFVIVRNALVPEEFIVVCVKCKNPLEPLVFQKNPQPLNQPNES